MNFDVFLFEFLYDLLEFRTKFQSDTDQGARTVTLQHFTYWLIMVR